MSPRSDNCVVLPISAQPVLRLFNALMLRRHRTVIGRHAFVFIAQLTHPLVHRRMANANGGGSLTNIAVLLNNQLRRFKPKFWAKRVTGFLFHGRTHAIS
jgi:hypothetical protein